jgi:hypothetical protein
MCEPRLLKLVAESYFYTIKSKNSMNFFWIEISINSVKDPKTMVSRFAYYQ